MTDLKPCPFCGGEATLLSEDLSLFPVWWVQCAQRPHPHHTNCFKSKAEAIAAWNTRATPPEVAALVHALREIVDAHECGVGLWRPIENASAALAKWDAK